MTVHHNGARVTRLALSYDQAAVDRALGVPMDAITAVYSDIQALRAEMHTGLEVRTLAPLTTEGAGVIGAQTAASAGVEKRARSRWWIIGAALLSGAAVGVAGVLLDRGASKGPGEQPTTAARQSTGAPRPVSPTPTSATATPKPSVVLSADLAFASNSATVSAAARSRILELADNARNLSGVIHVDGYTDNVGTAASGLRLSKARADAVAAILRSALLGSPSLTVLAIGHGETDPVATNTTAAGRARNRRVTIYLPAP